MKDEYKREYTLIIEIKVCPCEIFTGAWSFWLTGPKKVDCVGPWGETIVIPGEEISVIPKGSLVRIEKIYELKGFTYYHKCRVRIVDTKGNSRVVYADWPSFSESIEENK